MLFRINIFYFLTLLLLQGHQSKARGPVCLQCDQVSQPSDCRNIKRCGDQELCSMRKYVTNNGHMWFDVGCSSSQRCSPITSILGKRGDDDGLLPIQLSKLGQNGRHNIKSNYVRSAGDTIVCEKCCSGDICNAGSLCGTVGFLHEMVCFNCTSTHEDGCSTIALCDQNEKCFIEKVGNSSTSNSVWKTGCRHNDKCQQLQSSPGTECLSSCCTSDVCNMKCSNNNTDASCVDKSQTCTNTTFQSFVCATKELQAVCPRSCGLCHCTHNPCTHGTCTSSQQGYKCTCDAGYTGSICDRVIDHCSPNPCVHGICNNSLQGYNCSCFSGYEGSTCTELNPCEPNPCKHGSCHKGPNGYDCTCFIGYTGSTCETALPLWRWKDCSNPATRSMSISYLDISPKPIRIPGNITSAYDIRINQRIGRYVNSPLQLNVTLDKALLGRWHAVPCNNKIGTCIYDDLCEIIRRTFFTRTCPQAIIDAGYTCGCPIRIDPAHLVMNYHPQREVSSLWQPLSDFGLFGNGIESIIEVVLQLFSGLSDVKKISPQYSFLTTGTFRGRFELLERNQMIGCLAVEFSMKTPCYGFLCGG